MKAPTPPDEPGATADDDEGVKRLLLTRRVLRQPLHQELEVCLAR